VTEQRRGTVKPDANQIKALRARIGWRVEDLAKHAKCSSKTIENVERGANVYIFTLKKIAEAFGVEYHQLLADGDQVAQPEKKERRIKIELKLSIPFHDFDESDELMEFIHWVKKLLNSGDDIDVDGVEEGSVMIKLEISERDLQSLLDLFYRGMFASGNVDAFRLEGHDDWVGGKTIIKIDVPYSALGTIVGLVAGGHLREGKVDAIRFIGLIDEWMQCTKYAPSPPEEHEQSKQSKQRPATGTG